MTRTHPKFQRLYINGYDLSGQARDLGTTGVTFSDKPDAALSDAVENTIIGRGSIQAGPFNAFLDPKAAGTTGLHELMYGGQLISYIMAVYGTPGGPIAGDPMFAAAMQQGSYTGQQSDGMFPVNIDFKGAANSGPLTYDKPFGYLIHAKGAETAANSANTNVDNGAATTAGGIFVYQMFSSNGTATLSLDDSANGTSWVALSGATSGNITAASAPKYGMVALATTATVRQYIRWQLALGTASTVTFACGLIRG